MLKLVSSSSPQNNQQKYKGTDEEDLLEDQEVDNQASCYDDPQAPPATQMRHDDETDRSCYAQPSEAVKRRSHHLHHQAYREQDVERGETVVVETAEEIMEAAEHNNRSTRQHHQQPHRNYHDRYSYAGYEPEREFKDYSRDRELMLQRQRNAYNSR